MFLSNWVTPLRHVGQRQTNDCAIAATAIVAQVPYESVVQPSRVKLHKDGMSLADIRCTLKQNTGSEWRLPEFGWFRAVPRFAATGEILLLLIREPKIWVPCYHCIVIQSGMVYDPEMPAPYSIDSYPRKTWRVMHVLRKGIPSRAEWMLDRLKLIGWGLFAFLITWTTVVSLKWVTGG